jgi:hypothetical protein
MVWACIRFGVTLHRRTKAGKDDEGNWGITHDIDFRTAVVTFGMIVSCAIYYVIDK